MVENVVKGIELIQRAVKMRDIVKSTSRLHGQIQSVNYPKKRRKGILGRTRKSESKIQPKNNILDSLVQVMDNYNNSNIKADEENSFGHNVFETHDSIIARVKIPEGINPKKVKVFVGTSSASIYLNENKSHVIMLPKEIKKEGTIAKIKENILEFRAPKLDREYMHEINIRH